MDKSQLSPDEAFSYRCYKRVRLARSRRPFQDGDRIVYVRITRYPRVSEGEETQIRYWEARLDGSSHAEALAKMIIEEVSEDREVQRRYEELCLSGMAPKLAECLAARTFPGFNGTNKAFNRGRANGNQFSGCPALGNYYRAIAEAQGVSTTGRYYCHGLGRYPGDPRAWVQDTSDVLRIARERNLNIDGIVTHRADPVPPTPDIPLAEDIWEDATQEILSEDPDMRYEDAREKAFNLRTGKIDNHPLLVDDHVPHPDDILDE